MQQVQLSVKREPHSEKEPPKGTSLSECLFHFVLAWRDARDMRAAPMTRGIVARGLISSVMAGQSAYARNAVKCIDGKEDVPSSKYSPLTEE